METAYRDAGTARLLSRVLKAAPVGRCSSPTTAGPGKVVSPRDVCPATGLARLSYGQARTLPDEHTSLRGLGAAGICTSPPALP